MANEIKLVTYANSEVTPQNDAVLTNLEIPSNGVIFGCNVTIKNASTLHINAGMGVVYGREFEIVDSDIPVSLSSSGTLLGQLYVHIDLANTSEPAQLLVDTGNSLTPLVDDPTINITTGSTDYQLATFTVDTSTLDNLVETFDTVRNASALVGNTDISGIADGTLTGGLSQLNSDLTVNDLSSKVSTVTANFTADRLILKQIGHLYIVDFSCTVVNAFNGGVARLLIQFTDFTPANFNVYSICNHLNSSAIPKGITRMYSSSDGIRIMTKDNASTGDIIQGQIIFTA